jgi:hypothetical protein
LSKNGVEGGARTQSSRRKFVIRLIIAPSVRGFSLNRQQLLHDLLLCGGEFFGDGLEDGL